MSQAVVSTVLNARANNGIFVSEQTKQRVLSAATDLGYIVRNRPLPPVRRISNGNSDIGHMDSKLVALLLGRRFSGSLAYGHVFTVSIRYFTPRGYHPIVLDTYADTYQKAADKEAEALNYVRDHNCAGVILWHEGGPANVSLIQDIRENVCPVVAIDRRVPGLELDFIGSDNVIGAYKATQHLIDLGHRRIGHLTTLGMTDAAAERLMGYQQCLRDNGIEINPPAYTSRPRCCGRRLDRGMFSQVFSSPAGTCIILFLLSDYWAPVVYSELKYMNLTVPDDVAIVGFDDVNQPGLEAHELTTMAQDFEGIGKTAAERILLRIQSPDLPPQTEVFPARVGVIRQPTGTVLSASFIPRLPSNRH